MVGWLETIIVFIFACFLRNLFFKQNFFIFLIFVNLLPNMLEFTRQSALLSIVIQYEPRYVFCFEMHVIGFE